jgi:putative transposase
MTKNYKSKQPGIPYFLTFTIVKWINVFIKPEYCHILWDSLQYCRKEKGMKLYAFVFMTNHIYLIMSASIEETPLWHIIRDFKKFTAQKIIQKMQQEENRDWILNLMKETGEKNGVNTQYQFWIQDDGAIEISSEKFFHQKINYLHYNPVRAQIVLQPEDYGWSSARLYKKDDTKFLDSLSEIF